jgi:PAS domain-containing protein
MQDIFKLCGNAPIKNSRAAANISTNLQKITAQNALYFFHKNNPEEIQRITDTILFLTNEINMSIKFLDSQIAVGNVLPDAKKYISDFKAKLILSADARFKLIGLVQKKEWEKASEFRIGEYKDLVDASLASIKHFMDFAGQAALDFCSIDSAEVVNRALKELILTTMLAVIVLALTSIIIIYGIRKSLNQTIQAAYAVSRGNMDVNLHTNSKDETGELMRIFSAMLKFMAEKIDSELRFKEELISKSKWYEDLLDAMYGPISVTDMNKNLTFMNKAALNILGINSREEVIGKFCGDVWQADICKDDRCGIEVMKNDKGKSYFEMNDKTYSTEASYIKNTDDNKIGHIEVVENVTNELKLIEKLSAGANLYELILDDGYINKGIVVIDENKTIIYANSAALKHLNATKQEVFGSFCYEASGFSEKCTDRHFCRFEHLYCITMEELQSLN